jgi:hypothetical protein
LLAPFLLKKAFGYKIGYKDGIKKGGCFHTRPGTFMIYAAACFLTSHGLKTTPSIVSGITH